jgi:hypothetical protein
LNVELYIALISQLYLTVSISFLHSASPIITDERQARDASIARTLDGQRADIDCGMAFLYELLQTSEQSRESPTSEVGGAGASARIDKSSCTSVKRNHAVYAD